MATKTSLAVAAAFAAGAYLYSRLTRKRRVVITGGCGNLGTKLATRLCETGRWEVVLLEHPDYVIQSRVPSGAIVVPGDLTDGSGSWTSALSGADAVVHFSAVNPHAQPVTSGRRRPGPAARPSRLPSSSRRYPNASWEDSAGSMAHTFNLFVAAQRRGVRRVVFASSNHVMGGYKDQPDLGDVTPSSPPRCGTLLANAADRIKSGDAVAYAAAKLAGEQLARALMSVAGGSGGRTTFAVLRIGWCQPGANLPATLNPAGCPPEFQTKSESGGSGGGGAMGAAAAGESVEEAWFKVS